MTRDPDRYDVAVVGAGPAGAIAATLLARRGMRVLLLDRATFPRHKVCGDVLIGDSLAVLDRLGLTSRIEALSTRIRNMRVYSPRGLSVTLNVEFLSLKRIVLDEALVRAAEESGAAFEDGVEIAEMESGPDGAVLSGKRKDGRACSYRCELVLVATGACSKLLDRFGRGAATAYTAVASRAYFRSRNGADGETFVVTYDKALTPGYGWIVPLGGGEFNVGCGVFRGAGKKTNLRELFHRLLTACPHMAEFAKSAEQLGELEGAPLRSGMVRTLPALGRTIAIGESQGMTLPFSGEGIGKAMESAEIAAEVATRALEDGDVSSTRLAGYVDLLKLMKKEYSDHEWAQRWLARPWFADVVAWRAGRSRYFRELLEKVLQQVESPRAMNAVHLARSFVS